MKTLKDVHNEIKSAMDEIAEIRKQNLSGERTITSKLQIMKKARTYLEFEPTKESVEKQKTDVTRWLKIHSDRFLKWLEENPKRKELQDPKAIWIEQNEVDLSEVKKWKQELKFLNYILS